MEKISVIALVLALALTTLAVPTPGRTSNDPTISAEQASQLWTMLEGLGYAIRSVDHERHKIQVEAYKDGIEYDIDLDPSTLAIVRETRDD